MKIALDIRSPFRVHVLMDKRINAVGSFSHNDFNNAPKMIRAILETNEVSRIIAIPDYTLEIVPTFEYCGNPSPEAFETSKEIEKILDAVAYSLDPDGPMERVPVARLLPLLHHHR